MIGGNKRRTGLQSRYEDELAHKRCGDATIHLYSIYHIFPCVRIYHYSDEDPEKKGTSKYAFRSTRVLFTLGTCTDDKKKKKVPVFTPSCETSAGCSFPEKYTEKVLALHTPQRGAHVSP